MNVSGLNKNNVIAFVSTYPSRECGIATFTQDLVNEFKNPEIPVKPVVVAVSDDEYDYDDEVIMEIDQHKRNSYKITADRINSSDIDLVVVEHEYGIYGGDSGEYLLELIYNINVPVITTLHTVLPEPTQNQKKILRELGNKSIRVVTMAKNTINVLKEVYNIDGKKIKVINHGVPLKLVGSRKKLKKRYGLNGINVISTFGLLGPGKGLEYGIDAISKIAHRHRDVMYLILGQTHPYIKKVYGEGYREKLKKHVNEAGIENNVRFINKYLSKDEIIRYLQMTDIYLTPYIGKDQAVSGTLAYAVGYGRVVVSTPYSYAKEMLSEGRGLLAKFHDSESIARCIDYVLTNPDEKRVMEQKTRSLGNSMMWYNIAVEYMNFFVDTLKVYNNSGVKVG